MLTWSTLLFIFKTSALLKSFDKHSLELSADDADSVYSIFNSIII